MTSGGESDTGSDEKRNQQERIMGEHKHGEMDISVHEKTFDNFMAWTKWSVIVILALLILMAVFIV